LRPAEPGGGEPWLRKSDADADADAVAALVRLVFALLLWSIIHYTLAPVCDFIVWLYRLIQRVSFEESEIFC